MRSLTDPADDSLRSRRRAVESASLVSRSIGLVSTAVFLSGLTSFAPLALSGGMKLACWLGLVLMTAANVLALRNRQRPGSRRYPLLSALQVLLDTVTLVALVTVAERETGQTTWPLLTLTITIAAIRHRLLGALLTFAATSVAYLLAVPGSPDIAFVLGVNLMIAVISGTQSSAFARQLTVLQETRRELQHRATHDALTGLPNRDQLAEHADQRAGRPLAVLLLDLNGFKQVNDTYGHAAGDLLLRQVAERLSDVLRPGDLAGRLGGDEFLVLLPETGAEAAAETADRIRAAVRRPVDVGAAQVTVGVSVGVALRGPGGGVGLDALTAEADAAMYRDKRGPSVAA